MKRIAFAALSALALGGCFHEAALDRHLYDRVADVRGTNVPLLSPVPQPLIAPAAQPAPPMRDPNAPDASLPAPLQPTTPTPPSPN